MIVGNTKCTLFCFGAGYKILSAAASRRPWGCYGNCLIIKTRTFNEGSKISRMETIRNYQQQEDANDSDAVCDEDESNDLSQSEHTYGDSLPVYDTPKAYFSAYEWAALFLLVSGAFYAYFSIDLVVCFLTRMFACLGHSSAQYLMGQRYLTGTTVTKNHTLAIEWFRLAANKGHASACYNLAVSHFQGYQSGLAPGEAMELLKYAVTRGVLRAKHLLAMCERDKLCM